MKKQTLLFFLMLMPLMASAYDVEIDGIYYNLNQKTRQAEVTNGGTYDQFTGEIVIPQNVENESISYSVTSIGSYAFFNCSNLTSIEIPNSVTSIGNGAFIYCSNLTSIEIPNSVTSIGYNAFQGCSSLPVVDNCRYADTYLIEVINKTIATCTIKEGTRFIGDYAFFNCSNLTSIEIPNSVTCIGESAFEGCSSLTSIEIPNSVTSIGRFAFKNCSSLPIVDNCRYADTYLVEVVDITIAACRIKEGTRYIGSNAFNGCSNLTSIEIPNSVTSIGYSAFRDCGLTSITIPNSISTIGKHAFFDCSSLTDVTLTEGLTLIGEEAFHTCAISAISLPQSLIRIGEQAFQNCRQLTSITLPKNVAYLGNADYIDSYGEMIEEDDLYGDVFNGCDLLTEIKVDEQNQVYTSVNGLLMTKDMKTLLYIPGAKTDVVVPEGTETIYRHAVSSDNLTTITLPKSLKSIEEWSFDYSSELTSIISKMETPATVGSYSFSYRVYDNATLYVPIGTKSKYEAADSWKNFKNIVESGDVNGDGSVSVTDVVSVINYILGNHVANFLEVAADANCDGTIAITDVVRLINIILNDDSYAKPSVMFEE